MRKIFGKNQIMIGSLALMIALAGYFNFAGRSQENVDETEVSAGDSSVIYDISMEDIDSLDSDATTPDTDYLSMTEFDTEGLNAFLAEEVDSNNVEGMLADNSEVVSEDMEDNLVDEIPGEAVFASSAAINNLAEARLAKEQIRAKNRESIQEMLNSTNLSEKQKTEAMNSMIALTQMAEKEMSAEILLEAKGFKNAIVSITGDTVDVCIAGEELSEVHRAQIVDIIKRKTGIEEDKIVITPVKES